MGGNADEGPEGRVPGAEKLTFALVDCSGLLPVLGPAHTNVNGQCLKGHLNCFLGFWAIPKNYKGVCSGYADLVWQKMNLIGQNFNLGLRMEKWRAPELFRNLMKECETMEIKFKQGMELAEQCRDMKMEAMVMATSMTRALPPAAFPQEYERPKDPVREEIWGPAPWEVAAKPAGKGRVPEAAGKGERPLLHPQGTPPRSQVPKQKARPKAPPPQLHYPCPEQQPKPPVPEEPQARPEPEPTPPVQAAEIAGRPLTPAEQFRRPAPWHRRGRVPEPPGPPPGHEGRVPEPAGPSPGGQKGRVPEPPGPPPVQAACAGIPLTPAEQFRQAPPWQGRVPREPPGPPPGRVPMDPPPVRPEGPEGRVPREPPGPPPGRVPMCPPPEKFPGKTKLVDREPLPLREPPAKKSVLPASAPARPGMREQQEMQADADSFRKTLLGYAKAAETPYMQQVPFGYIDRNKVGKGRKGKGINPNLVVGKGRPGEPHPAWLKHVKTEKGGLWLEPAKEEDEFVEVVVDEEQPVPPGPEMEEEGEGRVPAVPEEEMFQDLCRGTSVRQMEEEEGQGRVPEEEEEPMDQYQWHSVASHASSSSWVHVQLFGEEIADRANSQAATRKLGDHLNEEEEGPEEEDAEMPPIQKNATDPLVQKVISELGSMSVEKAVTMPPARPQETEEEQILRALRARIPTSTKTVTLSKYVGVTKKARLPMPVPEGAEFNPKHNDRRFNGVTATVITQLLMAVHEITVRECDSNKLTVSPKDREWNSFRSKGSKTVVVWMLLRDMGVPQVDDKSEPGEWHLWLQREKGQAVIEKILSFMFGCHQPRKGDTIFGKQLTYWFWFAASEQLCKMYSEEDIQTKRMFPPTDLNNWILPLAGKIWAAYNYTMLVYCMRKVEQKAECQAKGEILETEQLMEMDVEVSDEDLEDREVVYHSHVTDFLPDWGATGGAS